MLKIANFAYYTMNVVVVLLIGIYLQQLFNWTWQWVIIGYLLYLLRFLRLSSYDEIGNYSYDTRDFQLILEHLILAVAVVTGLVYLIKWITKKYAKSGADVASAESTQGASDIPKNKQFLKSITFPIIAWVAIVILSIFDKHGFDMKLNGVYLIFFLIHLFAASGLSLNNMFWNFLNNKIKLK